MNIPPVGWRVPYVIVYGEPGRPLIHSVRKPEEVLFEANPVISVEGPTSLMLDSSLRPNASYYIMKVIVPVLGRCFSLLGVNVLPWYIEMSKVSHQTHIFNNLPKPIGSIRGKRNVTKQPVQQGVIPHYFLNKKCIGCENSVITDANEGPLCHMCRRSPQRTVLKITKNISDYDKTQSWLHQICYCCAMKTLMCQSLDCPILYARLSSDISAGQIEHLKEIISTL